MRKLRDAVRLKLEGGQSHQQIADSLLSANLDQVIEQTKRILAPTRAG